MCVNLNKERYDCPVIDIQEFQIVDVVMTSIKYEDDETPLVTNSP